MSNVIAQLARPFKEGKDDWMWDDGGILGERKLDGHRLIVHGSRQFSRNGKEKEIRFLESFRGLPKIKLDGEIVVRRNLDLPQGHSEVGHWLSENEENLELVVFDLLTDEKGHDLTCFPLNIRLLELDELFDRKGLLFEGCITSRSQRFHSFKKQQYDSIVAGFGEGMMLKPLDSLYVPGSRSKWVKKKAYKDVDVVITDCDSKPSEWRVRPGEIDRQTGEVLPDGDHTEPWKLGYVGLSYGFYDQHGKLRRVGSLGFTGLRAELEKYIGRVAITKCFGEQFSSGAIQHPVFQDWRDDKDPEECVFEFTD